MGWCESPPLFFVASETAIDVIGNLLQEVKVPEHPLEDKMLAENCYNPRHRLTAAVTYTNLVVHYIFSSPYITKHQGQVPISQKYVAQGEGTWATTR